MIPLLVGGFLGAVYFGGLYYSVRKMEKVKHPALLMIASFIIRMGILVGVFYYVSKGGYKDMLFTLLGVVLVRYFIIFKTKKSIPKSDKKG